ncbi:MAG: GNAT family N-acetyltransferase [Bryobacteraceae bacterium]
MSAEASPTVTIREFAPGDAIAFRQLNEEWITRYFALEAKDVHALEHPEDAILKGGGRIFFSVKDGVPVGCCALVSTADGEFEVAKMAVTEQAQGLGIGRGLLQRVIDEARDAGATRLFLNTNTVLTPAIRLYESVGFRHIPAERVAPSEYVRANVFMELWFQR